MFRRGAQIAEALFLRAVPGLINLFGLTTAASVLSGRDYGLFSTTVATSGAVASFLFGPLTFAVVTLHAKYEAEGQAREYEQQQVSSTLLLAAVLLIPAAVLILLGVFKPEWVACVLCFAIYTSIQEIHHARLKFAAFSLAASCQAVCFVALLKLSMVLHQSLNTALSAFAASYGIGAVASLALAGFPKLCAPTWSILRRSLHKGLPLTLSTLAADLFGVGYRYVLIAFGALPLLGVFSFCLDIAQRLVGILINMASFALVPLAFKADADGDGKMFRRILWEGTVLSASTAAIVVTAVLVAHHLHLVPALKRPVFEPIAFVIISAAVVLNRAGKLALNPIAIRAGKSSVIVTGYLVAGPTALALAAAALASGMRIGALVPFLAGFGLWILTCAVLLRRTKRSPLEAHGSQK